MTGRWWYLAEADVLELVHVPGDPPDCLDLLDLEWVLMRCDAWYGNLVSWLQFYMLSFTWF